ncbi:MAG: radical SAM protein [Theionarchaea archaeon]|nr:radical SAM protein [Theionarchaea archaeon]
MQMKVISRNNELVAVNLENLNLFRIDETESRILSLYEKELKISDIALKLDISEEMCEKTLEVFCNLPKGVHLNQEDVGILDELLLMVALDCNMACRYCYGDGGTYNRERTLMDINTALRAVDTAVSLGDIKVITLFGGEPLLNFNVIGKVVQTYPDITCGIITNGTIMTEEIAQFIKEYNIPITVSIDGPQMVHDAVRYYRDGRGTHKKVVETIEILKEKDISFAIEATYTKQAVRLGYSARDILNYLYEYTSTINFASVGVVDDPECRLSPDELMDFRTQCIDFTFDKIEKGEPINIFDITALIFRIASPERVISKTFCPYHARRMAVFPNGDAFPCYLVAEDKFKYGNVFESDFVDKFTEKAQKILPILCRDRLSQSYWFVPLLTHICVSTLVNEGDTFSLNDNMKATGSPIMEHLLYRMSTIRDWSTFFSTVQQK